jgi:hypothetical protein
VKPDSSASWFVGIKHLHRKYELKEAISYSKTKWTRTVKEAVYFEFHRKSGDVFTRMAVDLKQWMDFSFF